MDVLKIGQTVNWRGAWGKDEPKDAKVISIQLNTSNGSSDGQTVKSVEWDKVVERNVIVILSNGRWAWGFQISKKD